MILLTIAYDGTNYCGWQRQNGQMTIQQKIEEALESLFNKKIMITGASRTDTGVHAKGQCAIFSVDSKIPINKLPIAINAKLPDDIVITDAMYVDETFHPQYDAKKKIYQYTIQTGNYPDPMIRNYSEFVRGTLDIQAMNEATKYVIGTHDFKSFCSSGGSAKTSIRTIYEFTFSQNYDIITMQITGNGFLYNMVRIIAGTFVYIGRGKVMPYELQQIILSKDRTKAGKTAGAAGLTLLKIYYQRNIEKGE